MPRVNVSILTRCHNEHLLEELCSQRASNSSAAHSKAALRLLAADLRRPHPNRTPLGVRDTC